jgi:AmpD protein
MPSARTPRYTIDAEGWLATARRVPSPNFNERPAGTPISLLVIHSISLPPQQYGGAWIDDFFQNRLDCNANSFFAGICTMKVSSHLLIRRDGEMVQYVPFLKRAWHAGVSSFDGVSDCNDFSIGIELEGCDADGYEAAQYRALAAVTRAIRKAYPKITGKRIAGHCDIAPGRKTDPGPHFDWPRYRKLIAARKAAGKPTRKAARKSIRKSPRKKTTRSRKR